MCDQLDQPFPCDEPGCQSKFSNFDHLTAHKKRHGLCLDLPATVSDANILDQTPTPSRFLDELNKGCEEEGLNLYIEDISDITPVKTHAKSENPFDETFKNAIASPHKKANQRLSLLLPEPGTSKYESLNTPCISVPVKADASHLNKKATESVKEGYEKLVNETVGDVVPPTQCAVRLVSVICSPESHFATPLTSLSSLTLSSSQALQPPVTAPKVRTITSTSDVAKIPIRNNDQKSNLSHKPMPVILPKVPAQPQVDKNSVYQIVLKLPDGRALELPIVQPVKEVNAPILQPPLAPQTLPITNMNTRSLVTNSSQPVVMPDIGSRRLSTDSSGSLNFPKAKSGRKSKFPPGDDPTNKKVRSLERNRAAATRCRRKRKAWIETLETKASELEETNEKLQKEIDNLRSEVTLLKSALLRHKDCPVTLQQLKIGDSSIEALNSSTESVILAALIHGNFSTQNNSTVL